MVRHTSGGNAGSAGNQMASLGLSGNLTESESESDYDFMDVNGDGLPDKVHQSGGTLMVALNVGYGFLPAEAWGSATINESESQGVSLGGSIGFNDGIYGFGGGLNVSRSESETDRWLGDLNGDGLLDRVSGSGVSYNTGNAFIGGSSNLGDTMTNSDTTAGGGVYFTIGIPLGLLPISIIINPGADVSRSVSRQEVSFSDINGDGYPDYLHSTEDNSMSVGLSQIGRTNMLKGVERPLGATMEVDYERSGNTYDQPHNQWVMSRLEVNDGHVGDGVDVQVMTYQYEDGFYHRQERDFYGYETVITEQRDHSNADALYRTVTQLYHNDSYYNKGLLEREFTADAEGNLYLETENTYLLRDIETGNELANPQDLTATVFPELRRTEKRFYEGEATAGKSTYTTFEYDALGNVTGFVDAADIGAQDDVSASIGYHSDEANYIMGKAETIEVYGNGTLMRRREADFETGTGNLLEVREYLGSGEAVITNIQYDDYGNIELLTGPTNHKGQRYSLDYTYDEHVHTYNTSVLDSFGYISSATYNLFYGQTLVSTDINQQSIEYTYDNFGRTETIVAPYQTDTGLYTIQFEYHPDDELPWALSKHIDVYRDVDDPIETVLFTDGLKRVIQTKKDATLHTSPTSQSDDAMIVSGHLTFDFVGRTIEQYYPITEDLGNQGTFNPGIDVITPTITTYDVLDRNLTTTIPDNTTTSISYGFGSDRNAQSQFLTKVTDANGISKESYRDVRGLITAVKEFNNDGAQIIWTSYQYDPLKQITSVFDDHYNITTVSYDNLGRRTTIDSPDMGLTETIYDLASNVVESITSNLREEGVAISYDYDYNRLNSISYPLFAENNVSYSYGLPGAEHNRANRLVTVTDESGTVEHFYGPLGETIQTINTIASDTQGNSVNSPEVYTTTYTFDTFNRLQRMVYPDSEVLTNDYDSGGLLRKVTGVKAEHDYEYIDRLEYDKFEQRTFIELPNNIQTSYSYNPLNRRLASLQTGTGQGQGNLFQDLVYEYDDVGNILGQANLAAVNSPSQMGGATQFTYEYDDLYRLVHSEGTFEYQPNKYRHYNLDMAYDTIHNITGKNQLDQAQQPSGTLITQKKSTYDWEYAYDAPQPHAPTHIGVRTYSYDANGNQTGWDHDRNGTRRTITWDEENRIQSIADNGHTMTYKYNAAGERVIKRGPQGETAYVNQFFVIRNREVGTKHIYAGSTRIVSKLMKQSSNGNGNGNGNGGGNGNGNTPLEKDLYFYHPDHLGSSSYVTDAQGQLYQHLEYFPFGETWVEESSNTQRTPYLFTAKELDEETGLYYFGARYYDARTSVWQSPDPILGEYLPTGDKERDQNLRSMGGVFNSFNLGLYTYTHQNPVKYVDPDGKQVYTDRDGTEIKYPEHMAPEYTKVSVEWDTVFINGESHDRVSEPYGRTEYAPPSPRDLKKILKKWPKWIANVLENTNLASFRQYRRYERQYQKVYVFDNDYVGFERVPTEVTKWESLYSFREAGVKIMLFDIDIVHDNIIK